MWVDAGKRSSRSSSFFSWVLRFSTGFGFSRVRSSLGVDEDLSLAWCLLARRSCTGGGAGEVRSLESVGGGDVSRLSLRLLVWVSTVSLLLLLFASETSMMDSWAVSSVVGSLRAVFSMPCFCDVDRSVSEPVVAPARLFSTARRFLFRFSSDCFTSAFKRTYLSLSVRYLSSKRRFSQRNFSNTLSSGRDAFASSSCLRQSLSLMDSSSIYRQNRHNNLLHFLKKNIEVF